AAYESCGLARLLPQYESATRIDPARCERPAHDRPGNRPHSALGKEWACPGRAARVVLAIWTLLRPCPLRRSGQCRIQRRSATPAYRYRTMCRGSLDAAAVPEVR